MTLATVNIGGAHVAAHNEERAEINRGILSRVGVSVKADPYNAVANGTTNDTAAIHAARDAAGVGGTVYFPPGTYKTTTGLVANLANQQWILSPGAVILGDVTGHTIDVTANGFTLSGPGKVDTGATAYSGVFIEAGLSDIDILGVEIANGTYGVRIKGGTGAITQRVRVNGCSIHNTSSHGVFFNWEAVDCEISNNQIYSTTQNGIWVGNSSLRCKILDNTLVNIGRIGIENYGQSHGALVRGNRIKTTANIGISLDSSNNSTVRDNYIEAATGYGVECAATNNSVFAGNIIISPTSVGISISAPSGTCNDNLVEGNYILSPGGNGIYAGGSANGAKRLRIIGNTIIEPGNGAGSTTAIGGSFNLGCSDWVVQGNLIRYTTTPGGCSGININGVNGVIIGNHIIYDAAIVTAGGSGIVLPAASQNITVSNNVIVGNGKCSNGIMVTDGATNLLIAGNNISGTTSNVLQNLATSNTNLICNNIGQATSGSGFTYGSAIVSGNHTTAEAFTRIQGGVKIGASSTDTLGFYGAAVVARSTIAAAATDAATTQTLANSIRTILLNLGLVQ